MKQVLCSHAVEPKKTARRIPEPRGGAALNHGLLSFQEPLDRENCTMKQAVTVCMGPMVPLVTK